MNASHEGNLMRRIFNFALVAMLVAMLSVITTPASVMAADASWNNINSLSYEGKDFIGPADNQTVADLKLMDGTSAYTHIEAVTGGQSTMHVIYFPPDVDSSVATGAKYRTYVYQGPGSYHDASSPTDIAVDSQQTTAGTSSCDGLNGIGWIICPITDFLAWGMDQIYDILAGFLEVRPVEVGQTNSPLFRAWSYMLGFANVAFVIAFIIIIYSQLTSVGVSNYGIKKLLPRLIIAALLVNLSYLICAIAIDLSNILGYSMQNIFIEMRNGLVGEEGNSWDVLSWESISSFVLSGGTLISAGLITTFTTVSTFGPGTLFLLLPSLVIGLVAVLVALLVMAARQAIITILVVIAPLAFVAYLLPNTEKWFDKWRGLFMTMLILFPAFSVVFGGSQLAAMIIIQNADSLNLIVLGMLVQVAPLFITPMLVKMGGSLLAKIAGIVNNPNRGLIDRTRNFAKDRSENHAARRLGTPVTSRAQFLKRYAQHRDTRRRSREGWRNAHTGMADARWANSGEFSDIDQASREAADRKALGETVAEGRYSVSKIRNARLQALDVDLRNAKADTENAATEVSVQYDNLKSNASSLNAIPQHLLTRALAAQRAEDEKAILQYEQNAAKIIQQTEFATRMRDNEAMRNRAGGIDPNGPQRALAAATSILSQAHAETQKNMRTIIDRGNLSGEKLLNLSLGQSQIGTDGRVIEATTEMVEAAINMVVESGNITNTIELSERLDLSPASNEDHRLAFVEALRKQSNRPKYMGAGWMDAVTQGVPGGVGTFGIDQAIKDTIDAKKLSADVLVSQDKDVINRILKSIKTQGTSSFDDEALGTLKKQIIEAYRADEYKGRVAERDDGLRGIIAALDEGGVTYGNEASERSETDL